MSCTARQGRLTIEILTVIRFILTNGVPVFIIRFISLKLLVFWFVFHNWLFEIKKNLLKCHLNCFILFLFLWPVTNCWFRYMNDYQQLFWRLRLKCTQLLPNIWNKIYLFISLPIFSVYSPANALSPSVSHIDPIIWALLVCLCFQVCNHFLMLFHMLQCEYIQTKTCQEC